MGPHQWGTPEGQAMCAAHFGELFRTVPVYEDSLMQISALVGENDEGIHLLMKPANADVYISRAVLMNLLWVLMGGSNPQEEQEQSTWKLG